MNIYDLINKMTLEHKTIFDMPLKVTFYARVSTHKDVQLNSQENQVQTFTEMINNNKNWTLVQGYVDTIRGESAANRDSFQRMIADAKRNKFDLIVCKEISRFSRDILDSISYTRELFQNNVGVYFTSDNLCTIDRDSELRLGIMASIAQQEVARLSERIKFGHKKSIENGVVMGNSRIFGYTKKDGKLVIDEKEAEMVRMIYDLYATGDYSLRSIADIIYEKGYRNHSGNIISHTTIKSILQNPKNKGYYCGNKVKILDYRTKKQQFLDKDEWIMYKDETGEIVPAIVSEELWDRCNEMLKSKRVTEMVGNYGGKRFTSPLSGKVICGHCNKTYHHNSYNHSNNNVKRHWICQIKKRKAIDCPSFAIKDEEMIEILRAFFNVFIPNVDKYIDKYISLYKQQMETDNTTASIKKIQNEIANLENKKDKLLDLYSDNLITKEDFGIKNDKYQKQIDSLKSNLDDICNSENKIQDEVKSLNGIKQYFKSTSLSTNSYSETLIFELSKNLISQIIVNPISDKSADIIFVPKFGDNLKMAVNKENTDVSIGNITKKMTPIVTLKLKRFLMPHLHQREYCDIQFNLKLQM